MITVLEADLTINQGSRFEQPLNVKENGAVKDLTGCTARMQIRRWRDNAVVLASYTTENGMITINPTAGRVTIIVPASETVNYNWGDGFYDMELIDPSLSPANDVIRIMQGRVHVTPEVTR